MPQKIGTVTLADLTKLKDAGLTPQQAHDRIIREAEERHPRALGVIMKKVGEDYHIIAL